MLEIALFGEPVFTVDGRPHSFVAPPKTLPLLAYLLLHRNAPSARESLAGIFWPDCDEETARANLRRHLHYLRKAMPGGEWLRVDGKTVQWNAGAQYRLDIAEFEQQSNIAQTRQLAVKLYRGDFYRACEEEWIYFERERLRNMQLNNLAALAHDSERALNHVAAAAYARQLLEIEPWREDAVRVLMRARMQNGDRAGALAEYERFRVRLADEMDVEPMSETRELYEAFARKDDRAPAPASRPRSIVGRSSELQALLMQWRAATSGHGAFALIGGEAGVGKSALLQEFAREVRESRGIVLTGDVSQQGDAPYAAFTHALARAHIDGKLRLPGTAPATVATFADSAERGAFFASVATALRSISERSPLLLCIEDLHWASGDTIALLEFLERRLRDARVLIACSYRDDAIPPDHPLRALRRLLTANSSYIHVALNLLTPADTERVARRRLGERADDETVQMLYRRSHGNPFFLTELLENVAGGHEREIPDSIRDLVDERYERLSESAREIVLRFAVIGGVVSSEILSAVETRDERVSKALEELVQARFLREESTLAGNSYVFLHDVVRESLYEGMAKERRAALHAGVAHALEAISPIQYAASIANHYECAGAARSAARAYVNSAAQAVNHFANDDAERYARKALSLDGDPNLAMQAYGYLALVYHRSAKPEMQRLAAEEMEKTAERSGNKRHLCEAIYHRVMQAFEENDAAELKAQIERLRSNVPADPVWRARVEGFSGSYDAFRGSLDDAWAHLQNALALCRQADYAFGQLFCYVRLLELCDGHTRLYGALLNEARALERRLGDPDSTFLLAEAEAKLFLHVDRTQCQHSALRIVEAGERAGDQIYAGIGHMYLAAIATYRFEPHAAEQHFAVAYAVLQESTRRVELARLLRFRGLHYYNIGDVERGLEDSVAAFEMARDVHAYDLIAVAAANAMYGYALLQRPHEAERLAAQAWAELNRVRERYVNVYHLMLSLGIVLGAQGRYDEAIQLLRKAYAQYDVRAQKLHAAWIATSLSYVLLRAGRPQEARPYIETCLKILPDILDEGWMPQETLWQAAQVLHALNEREQAQQLLGRAAQIVVTRLAALPREEQQRRFLDFPAHREILRAQTENVWPIYQHR